MLLLFFRRIYLDTETKQPIKFSLPLLGEVSTQAPVLVLVLVGAAMVIYPLSKSEPDMAAVEGAIDTGGRPVSVLIVADPEYTHSQDASGTFQIRIPLLRTDTNYRVKYVVDKLIIDDQSATLKNGKIQLHAVQWAAPLANAAGAASVNIQLKKDVSDEELRRLAIGS